MRTRELQLAIETVVEKPPLSPLTLPVNWRRVAIRRGMYLPSADDSGWLGAKSYDAKTQCADLPPRAD